MQEQCLGFQWRLSNCPEMESNTVNCPETEAMILFQLSVPPLIAELGSGNSPFPLTIIYRKWKTFLVVLVIYTAWVSPFEVAFIDEPGWGLSIADNVVNLFFAIEIVLTFFVAYLQPFTYVLVDDPKKIAWRYLMTWLIFDIVSTIPFQLVREILPKQYREYGLLSMLRLQRLSSVNALFSRLEKDRNYSFFWIRCAKLICITFFAVHCAGCFFYILADRYHDPAKTWLGEAALQEGIGSRYVTTIYWSITTMTTVGYGDLHPVNKSEKIFVIFYMLFILGWKSYLIGNMVSLVFHGAGRTMIFRDTIQAALSFAQRNLLPACLQDQMLAHLCLKFRTESEGLQQQETLESFPKAIRSNISNYLFYPIVDNVYLFRGVSYGLLFQLVSEMEAEYYPPKSDVILHNEAPTDFYILVTGALDVLVLEHGVSVVVRELKPGDLCGEIGVLCCTRQMFTVRTRQLSQLLRVNRTMFMDIVQANAGDGTLIMINLLEHLKSFNDPIMNSVYLETQSMVQRGRMDLPLSLCIAATRGDDLLLQQLLKWGLDPNESDSSGRTSLHIASSNRSEKCVLVLLGHGADPNRRDTKGNVALWEAILGGHEAVVKRLLENGASIECGDMGHFACTAAEHNNLPLLKEIVRHGGDVTQVRARGNTALHVAVCKDNVEMMKYLLEQGADVDKLDVHGWTPRDLAEQRGHQEIQFLFRSQLPFPRDGSSNQSRPRRRTNDSHNSL